MSILRLKQYRHPSKDHGTFGAICDEAGYPLMVSLERPWLNNILFKSCIPAGLYKCVRVKTGMDSVARALKGSGLPEDETFEVQDVAGGRYLIRFHPANWMHQLLGCIATGTSYGYMEGKPSIKSSRKAFLKLMIMLKDYDEFELEIIDFEPKRRINKAVVRMPFTLQRFMNFISRIKPKGR